MTPFQWLVLPFLGALLLWEIQWFLRRKVLFRPWLVRCTVWSMTALGIAYPELATEVANRLGIQRGADLVSYVIALAFLGVSFYFYSRTVRLQRQMTALVRHLALTEARRGGSVHPGE